MSYQQRYIDYIGFSKKKDKEGLSYFRDRLFISILLLTLFLGSVSYIPSALVAVKLNKFFVLYVDSFAMLVVAFIAFNKRIGLQTKKILFSANFFLMSFALVLYLGFEGNGTILLFVLNVLITLYSGRKAGLDSVIITAVFKPFYQVDIKNKKRCMAPVWVDYRKSVCGNVGRCYQSGE
ncbi:hypothetical protein ACFFU9_08485 [Mariniflexile ostreae]|uniref:MASE11 domain-containing protein n=1 Tax=Mariniflexile ostreae TaxID=1520892 RepID=A0ABV5FBF0_9FLAO